MSTSSAFNLSSFHDGPLLPIPLFASCVDVNPPLGGLPASLAPVDDNGIATNNSAAGFEPIDDAPVTSPDVVCMVILTATTANRNPVKDTKADRSDPPAVIVTVNDAPATGPGVTTRFIFDSGFTPNTPWNVPPATAFIRPSPAVTNRFIFTASFPPDAHNYAPLATAFINPGHNSRVYFLYCVVKFKFLGLRTITILSAFLLTMQDITKEKIACYQKKHGILRP